MSLSKVFPAAAGSGPIPGFWANSVTKAHTGDSLAANPICIVPGAGDTVYVVAKSTGSAWTNTNARMLIYEFEKSTGDLLSCRSHGLSADTAAYGNTADSDNFRIACLNDSNNLVVVGREPTGGNAKVTSWNSAWTEQYEVDTNNVFTISNVAATNGYVAVLQHDSNGIQIINPTTPSNVDGGTLAGFFQCRDIISTGTTFIVTGSVSVSTEYHCGLEEITASTGATLRNVTWYDPAIMSTGDAAEPRALARDSSGNVYVSWTTDDASAQWATYITKFNSSFTHQWTKQMFSNSSFVGRPTMCMAPDETAVICMWYSGGSTARILQLATSDGTEEKDFYIQAAAATPYSTTEMAVISSDRYNVYIAFAQLNGVDLETISLLSIPQSDFEAWTTETYGEFDAVGVYGFGNTSITATTGSLGSTGITGTGTTPTAETVNDLDSETVSEDKDTY